MDSIFRGVVSNSAFGTSLLDLLKEESKCHLNKINRFANKIASLITKGITVTIFYELLTKPEFDPSEMTVLAYKTLSTLETKRQRVEDSCLANIDYWIGLDVSESRDDFKSNINSTNKDLLFALKSKYPWIHWHVCTYGGKKEPAVGPANSFRSTLTSTSKSLEVSSFVIHAREGKVENRESKLKQWEQMLEDFSFEKKSEDTLENLEKEIKKRVILRDQVQSVAVLLGDELFFSFYNARYEYFEQRKFGNSNAPNLNVFISRPNPGSSYDYVIAVTFKQANEKSTYCTETCSNRGTCYFYPYSVRMGCRCRLGYKGERCESSASAPMLKHVMNSLLTNTFKLPTFASIQYTLEDTKLYMISSLTDIKDSIAKLEAKIDDQFRSLGEFLSQKFDWLNVLLKYKDAIENLNYFQSLSFETKSEGSLNFNSSDLNVTLTTPEEKPSMMVEDEKVANFLLSPAGIQKWLYQGNFLIMGRRDTQFSSHKPLMFLVMDKNKKRLCYPDYKGEITRTYQQLILLQLRGYMLWTQAYSILNLDGTAKMKRYETVMKKQSKYLKKATCTAQIPNSKNFMSCSGGYYIHSSLDAAVDCADGYVLKGKSYIAQSTTESNTL